MTLDEAIKHCEEVAEEYQATIDSLDIVGKGLDECEECAKEHRQLAEWLRELKAYKEAYVEIKNKTESGYFGFDDYEEAEANGYRKAIKIIDKRIEEVKADGEI